MYHVSLGLDLHCAEGGGWYFGDYRNVFLPNMGEDQKKDLQSERGAPGIVPLVNPVLVVALST